MVRLVKNILYCVGLILMFCLSASDVHANKQDDAKKNYKAALELFEAEEFEAALPYFVKAYEISGKRPVTVLGLAQCERALKMYTAAIKHFEEYLASNPPEDRVEVVRSTIRLTHKLREDEANQVKSDPLPEVSAAPRAPPSPPPLIQDSTSTTTVEDDTGGVLGQPWFWIVTGVVVIGGGVAAAFALNSGTEEGPVDGGSTGVLIRP